MASPDAELGLGDWMSALTVGCASTLVASEAFPQAAIGNAAEEHNATARK
jgi:hypothetical protein